MIQIFYTFSYYFMFTHQGAWFLSRVKIMLTEIDYFKKQQWLWLYWIINKTYLSNCLFQVTILIQFQVYQHITVTKLLSISLKKCDAILLFSCLPLVEWLEYHMVYSTIQGNPVYCSAIPISSIRISIYFYIWGSYSIFTTC